MALSSADINEFLDENVGSNYKILPDVLERLKKERKILSNQLSGRGEGGEKGEWQKVMREIRLAITELESLKGKILTLKEDITIEEEKKEGKENIDMKKLVPLLKELSEIERLKKYLLWINKIQKLSSRILSCGSKDGEIEDAIKDFVELVSISEALSSSHCSNLKIHARTTCEKRRNELKEKVSHNFDELLKTINWPITKDTSAKSLQLWQQKRVLFATNFKQLLAIDGTKSETRDIPKMEDPLPLPIDLLLSPLRKRFKYHFCGNRQTNSKEKPEWFFTQVSTWITDHTHFMETEVQPTLLECSKIKINAKVEFIRGLLQEIVQKLRHDLDPAHHSQGQCLLDDDYLTSHLIDELLLFEKELHEVHHYPLLYPSVIVVLQDEVPLCRWLNLERQFAAERLKVISESPTSWDSLYTDRLTGSSTSDELVPECAEKLMQIIAGITERFRCIPSLYIKLQFLQLQVDLLLEFQTDLVDNVSKVQSSPFSSRFSAYLNAADYMVSLLQKWGEETFFLELHYYTQQLRSDDKRFRQGVIGDVLRQIESLRKIDHDYAQLEGTAFDTVIEAFTGLAGSMKEKLIGHVTRIAKRNIADYKRERWHNLTLIKGMSELEVSHSLSLFLQKLQYTLHSIRTSINASLLDEIFDKICTCIDDIFLQQVICGNSFNDDGSSQLHYDMSRVLSPLLSQYMNRQITSNPILKTVDAACLLDHDPVAIQLLQHLSREALNGDKEAEEEMWKTLKIWNIQSLDIAQVSMIANLRIVQ